MKTKKTVICVAQRGRPLNNPSLWEPGLPTVQVLEPNWGETTNALTTVDLINLILITETPHEQLRREWERGVRLIVKKD